MVGLFILLFLCFHFSFLFLIFLIFFQFSYVLNSFVSVVGGGLFLFLSGMFYLFVCFLGGSVPWLGSEPRLLW